MENLVQNILLGKIVLDKLKNIMKYYKQIFVIQSETDMVTACNMYEAAKKAKRTFVETTFLCNISTTLNGSGPNPITSKKVYSYAPIELENENFEFKKKYVVPFYISSAVNKMKKEKYVMTINKSMLQDLQIFKKDGIFYDACVIYAMWPGYIEKDKELEDFITILRNYDMDYYELYTHGQINMDSIREIIYELRPRAILALDFKEGDNSSKGIQNFKILGIDEKLRF